MTSIILQAWEVQAILEGKKTQLRLPVKDQMESDIFYHPADGSAGCLVAKSPLGNVGDSVWVKETWATIRDEDDCTVSQLAEMNESGPPSLFYEANPRRLEEPVGKWRPPVVMPRWASRLTLEITNVRIERLGEMTQGDQEAEWIDANMVCMVPACICRHWHECNAHKEFIRLWDARYAKKGFGWDTNPFVWVYGIRKVEK